MRRLPAIALAAVFVSALLVRLPGLGREGLWVDEAYTMLLAQGPAGSILTRLQADDAPPLFYLAEKAAVAVAGSSEAAGRALPLAAGLGCVLLAWVVARRHFPEAAFPAAVLFAFSSVAIYYSRQARNYSLLHLLALALLLATLELRARPDRKRAALFALAALALAYTHNLAPLLIAPAILLAAPVLLRAGAPRRSGALALGMLALGGAPWALGLIGALGVHTQTNDWMGMWWRSPGRNLGLAPLYSWAAFANGAGPVFHPPVPLPALERGAAPGRLLLWSSMAVGVVSCALAFLPRGTGSKGRIAGADRRGAIAALFLFALFPLLGLVLTSKLIAPAYVLARTDTLALPGFLLLVALGWSRLATRPAGRAFLAAALVLWAGTGLLSVAPLWSGSGSAAKGSDARLARLIGEEIRPGDALVLSPLSRPTLEYYARRGRWWDRPAWAGSFPASLDANPAAVVPVPLDSLAAYREQALALRAAWEARGITRIWVLALDDAAPALTDWPKEPAPPPSARRTVTAASLSYPANVLISSLAGLRPIPVSWEYRQDWVSGRRMVLRIDRASFAPLDSLPSFEVRR